MQKSRFTFKKIIIEITELFVFAIGFYPMIIFDLGKTFYLFIRDDLLYYKEK